jgi:hypothetical protein
VTVDDAPQDTVSEVEIESQHSEWWSDMNFKKLGLFGQSSPDVAARAAGRSNEEW